MSPLSPSMFNNPLNPFQRTTANSGGSAEQQQQGTTREDQQRSQQQQQAYRDGQPVVYTKEYYGAWCEAFEKTEFGRLMSSLHEDPFSSAQGAGVNPRSPAASQSGNMLIAVKHHLMWLMTSVNRSLERRNWDALMFIEAYLRDVMPAIYWVGYKGHTPSPASPLPSPGTPTQAPNIFQNQPFPPAAHSSSFQQGSAAPQMMFSATSGAQVTQTPPGSSNPFVLSPSRSSEADPTPGRREMLPSNTRPPPLIVIDTPMARSHPLPIQAQPQTVRFSSSNLREPGAEPSLPSIRSILSNGSSSSPPNDKDIFGPNLPPIISIQTPNFLNSFSAPQSTTQFF
jgi:hypothetical protein